MPDPDWLNWSRQILTIARNGLAFSKDPYDLDRFRALSQVAARVAAGPATADGERVERLFESKSGGVSPKIGVRGAVFDTSGRILMVRETIDAGRWTLPGGWAEVNQTPVESVAREVFEESGYQVRVVKLAAVWDRPPQPPVTFSVARMFFVCALAGGSPRTSLETSEIGWFAEHDVPADLSLRRTLPLHISRMFEHWRNPELPTEFD